MSGRGLNYILHSLVGSELSLKRFHSTTVVGTLGARRTITLVLLHDKDIHRRLVVAPFLSLYRAYITLPVVSTPPRRYQAEVRAADTGRAADQHQPARAAVKGATRAGGQLPRHGGAVCCAR